MTDFNLRSLVHEVLNTSTLTDPSDIAAETLRRIKSADRQVALEQAIRPFVRQLISEDREPLGSTPTPGRSRAAAVRENWQRVLRNREFVPSTGAWLFLGEATHEQLVEMATHRDEKSRQNAAKARQYRALAAAVLDHKAKHVRDLPPQVLAPLLGGLAA